MHRKLRLKPHSVMVFTFPPSENIYQITNCNHRNQILYSTSEILATFHALMNRYTQPPILRQHMGLFMLSVPYKMQNLFLISVICPPQRTPPRGQTCKGTLRWLSARLQQLRCVSNGMNRQWASSTGGGGGVYVIICFCKYHFKFGRRPYMHLGKEVRTIASLR